MIAAMLLLTLGASAPAWINAATVVALAVITWRYARSAKRQAEAAESQARAASKQAEAAEHHLAILQSQIQEQAATALATLRENLAELKGAANYWFLWMRQWGQPAQRSQVDLLPTEWAVSLEHARRTSPTLHEELLAVQRTSREASRLMDQFFAKDLSYRSETDAKGIRELLARIMADCDAVCVKLDNLTRPQAHGQ
jgi:hypothetical protein